MPHLNGRALRIQKGDGASPEVFTSVAGAQEDSFTFERGEINVTDKDDAGYRALITGGIKSVSLSVSGVANDQSLLQAALQDVIENWRVIWLGSGTSSNAMLQGAFEISNFQNAGTNENGAITFTMELRSSGAFTFTPAVDS